MKEFQWKRLDKANREMALRLERLRKVHASGDKSGIGQKDRFDAKANRHRRESERGIRVLRLKHNQRVVGQRFQMSAKLSNVHVCRPHKYSLELITQCNVPELLDSDQADGLFSWSGTNNGKERLI